MSATNWTTTHFGPVDVKKAGKVYAHQPACGPYPGADHWNEFRFTEDRRDVTCVKCKATWIGKL